MLTRRAIRGSLLLIALIVAARAVGDEPAQELKRLRERQMFAAAVNYLEGLRTKPGVDTETKVLIPYELGSVHWERSGTIKNEQERLDVLDRAGKHLREFLKDQPAHVKARHARLLLGQVGIARGKALAARAGAAGEPELRKKLNAEALEEFKAARAGLVTAVKAQEAELTRFPAFVPRDQPELRREKNDARRDLIEASMYLGNASYEQAQLFERGTKSRAGHLAEAAGVFQGVRKQFRTVLAGMYAAVWEARCHQEMGALPEAIPIYVEVLSVESTDENVRDLQTKALRLAVECWSDPQQKQWREVVTRARAWVKETPAAAQETEDGWAILYGLAKAQHAILDTDKAPDPAEKTPKLTPEERKAMTESIISNARRVAASKSELAKEAGELLRHYAAPK